VNDSEATDGELVARVLKGEETAFTALMRRHKSWLYLFIRRHTSSSEDAWDILQESFASAWGALKRYDPQRPFEIWLRRIALNKCRDRGRREAVRRRVFSLVGAAPETVEKTPDPSARPDESRIAGETLRRLEAAVRELPAGLREPLVLTALQGLSQREAAEVLGVTPKVVEMRAYRARKRLAEALDREDIEDVTR
jgi:RNA polymerase sigma-70 factor (ECF subfamily)